MDLATKKSVQKIYKRLVNHVVTASLPTVIEPSVSVGITGRNPKMNFNNGYGILPFAMTASPEEIKSVVEQLELAKYKLTEQGDYYGAWKAGKRQDILLNVLSGMTSFTLSRL